MKLYVYVLEAKGLPVKESYAKLRVGKVKSKTRVLKNTSEPVWNEEFAFRINHVDEELIISVNHHDDDSVFHHHGSGHLLGRVRVPVWTVCAEENQTLQPTWFSLQSPKTGKFKNRDCGKILITLSVHGQGQEISSEESEGPHVPTQDLPRKIPEGKQLMKAIANRFEKLFNKNEESSKDDSLSELSSIPSDYEDCLDESPPVSSFEEAMETMQSKNDEVEMPENLPGGILVDKTYVVPPQDLNRFLFAPNSQFNREMAELQGTTGLQEGNWTFKSGDNNITYLTRIVTYTKAATKLIKSTKATEEQSYSKADGKNFAVLVSVSTPDVPYGSTFKIELLYKILPGPESNSGEESSRLIISYRVNFLQSTLMKGMIEGGAKQGLKESFDQFTNKLSQKFNVLETTDLNKDQMMNLQTEHMSDWELAREYFCNFTVVSALLMVVYTLVHILVTAPSEIKGLEMNGFDLPDSIGEVITCGILVISLERVYYLVLHFLHARSQRGDDHGVKAQGDGWSLTIALVEGVNLAWLDSTGHPDPYVVFTCNGKTRTSSVKLQTHNPQWNEILELDAMEEPPSVLEVEVFDFDGPFVKADSLGRAEINLIKHTSTELADMWVPLEGKLAQSSQSKLHLRIFLENNKGVETIKEYLTKKEKEVGKKLNLRSPYRNSTFQKLFQLPQEEFLISDFSCSLRRKMLLQGRLFLSARTVGFHANLFGHKTTFFFLWEDIEDIEVLPPTLASFGSPSLVMILQKGHGLEARHGAKSQDEQGRLRFYFQSFVSFKDASRTIMGLWRTRTLTPDQKAQITEEPQEQDGVHVPMEDTVYLLDVEDDKMSKVYSAQLPLSITSLMEIFGGGTLEHKVMEKSGCLNYTTTSWETVNPNLHERRVSYKFNRQVSIFGEEVTCTQQKSPLPNKGWTINEALTLHNIPFGDFYYVHFRYEIQNISSTPGACKCDIFMAIRWLKNTMFQQRITYNVTEKFTHRLKEIFDIVEKEILLTDENLAR